MNKVLHCTSGDLPPRLSETMLGKMPKGKEFIINALRSHTKSAGYIGECSLLGEQLFWLLT